MAKIGNFLLFFGQPPHLKFDNSSTVGTLPPGPLPPCVPLPTLYENLIWFETFANLTFLKVGLFEQP